MIGLGKSYKILSDAKRISGFIILLVFMHVQAFTQKVIEFRNSVLFLMF